MAPQKKENILFEGRTFQIVDKHFIFGNKSKSIEIARRSPGVRLIIFKGSKILLTKEFRRELNGYDYRLPGGKVFDSLAEYKKAVKEGKDMLKCAVEAAKIECLEETGLIARKIKHFKTSKAGQTIEWDMFYFLVEDFEESKKGQQLGFGEEIYPEWKTFGEAKELCKNKFNEDRSLGILFRFFMLKGIVK